MRYLFTFIALAALTISVCAAKSVELSSAQIYRSQGDYPKAVEFYKQAIADYEQKIAEAKAQNPDSAAYLKKAKGFIKDISMAYYEIGDCYKILGEYKNMAESFNKALEYGDKYVNDILDVREELWVRFYNDGVPLHNEQKFTEALPLFETAVMIDPDKIDGYRERGNCYLQLANAEKDSVKKAELLLKAETDMRTVITDDAEGKELIVRINLANMYYKMGDFDKAIPAYEEVLKYDAENLGAISQLALIFQERGEDQKAVDMYNKVLKTKSQDPDLWFNLGILYFNMGKFPEARTAFDNVLKVNPDDLETLMNLINALWSVQMQAETIPYLEHVVQIDANYTEAWRFLVAAYGNMAKNEKLSEKERQEYTKKANQAYEKFKALTGK